MKNIKLAMLNIRKNFQNEKELKSSFIISIFGMAINNTAFLLLWYYFGKTVGELNGWEAMDIFGLYTFGGISYGIVHSFFSGLFDIPDFISTGNLDKYLTTPKSILVKVTTSSISTSGLGDLLFGVVCFAIYLFYKELTILQLLLCLLFMVLTVVIYFSFSLICVSVSFYLMDGKNVSQGLHEIFLNNSLYHGGAYTGVLKFIFTFIIPSLLLGALPVEILKTFSWTNLLVIILLAVFWFIVSIMFFKKSLKKYESNNLYGFGS